MLLLADVFENFRDTCHRNYGLDSAHFYGAPGLAWQGALKMTGVALELLTDKDMLLMFEKGIRGVRRCFVMQRRITHTWEVNSKRICRVRI